MGDDSARFHPELLPLPTMLVGERVVVRPFRRGDGPALFSVLDDDRKRLDEEMPWLPEHMCAEDSEAFARRKAARYVTREDLTVALVDHEGELLGGSGLHRISWESRRFEIGYWLRASAEGKGIATEATQLLTALAFDRLGANRVEIRCHPKNERSAAVPKRLGFVHEAHIHNDGVDHHGVLRDTFVFAHTPETFLKCDWRERALAVVRAADADG